MRTPSNEHRSTAETIELMRHARLSRRHPLRWAAKIASAVLAVVLISGLSLSGIAIAKLSGNITTVTLAGTKDSPAAPAFGAFTGGFNLLLVGSDKCVTAGGCADRQENLNDVTMLLHVYADQKTAVAVSIPRDLIVPIPACPKENGSGSYRSMAAQPINNTLSYGGLACTVLTVEALTGLDIPYASLVSFSGVIGMSNAVGGVPVCVNGPINDKFSGLKLARAGEYTLQGEQALAFLRTRHGVGDGSDLGRISSQQVFLSSLVRTIKSDSTLTNIPRLLGLAESATSNMELSTSLASLGTMVSMALVLKDIPLESITFVQYPGVTGEGGIYSGKVAPVKKAAKALFDRLENDQPFTLDSGTGLGSVAAPGALGTVEPAPSAPATASPSATPRSSSTATAGASGVLEGVQGQTAAEYTCSKANR